MPTVAEILARPRSDQPCRVLVPEQVYPHGLPIAVTADPIMLPIAASRVEAIAMAAAFISKGGSPLPGWGTRFILWTPVGVVVPKDHHYDMGW